MMQPFADAMNRRDLTVPEMIFLAQLHQRKVLELRKSLVAEKELRTAWEHPGRT